MEQAIGWALMQVWDRGITEALSFTHDELLQRDGTLDSEQSTAVLGHLSLDLSEPVELPFESLLNTNPLSARPFVKWKERWALPIPGMVAREFPTLLEQDLLEKPNFAKRRSIVLEGLALRYLKEALPSSEAHANLYYPDPVTGTRTELDGLVAFDRRLLLIEAKTSGLSTPSLRGDVARLRADLRDSAEAAWLQSARARDYVLSSEGVTFEDEDGSIILTVRRTDLDRIYLINVTLDSLLEHAIHLPKLRELGLFKGEDLPWMVFINDLRIVSETVTNPAEFFAYLDWRNRLPLGDRVIAVDEIDLFGTFLLRSRVHDLLENEKSRIQVVGSSTDFDAFYLGETGDGPKTERPRMFHTSLSRSFMEMLRQERPPGWIDAGRTCLFLTLEELAFVDMRLTKLVRQVAAGEVLWETVGACSVLALGDGLSWKDVHDQLPTELKGRYIVFGQQGPRGPRIMWAIER